MNAATTPLTELRLRSLEIEFAANAHGLPGADPQTVLEFGRCITDLASEERPYDGAGTASLLGDIGLTAFSLGQISAARNFADAAISTAYAGRSTGLRARGFWQPDELLALNKGMVVRALCDELPLEPLALRQFSALIAAHDLLQERIKQEVEPTKAQRRRERELRVYQVALAIMVEGETFFPFVSSDLLANPHIKYLQTSTNSSQPLSLGADVLVLNTERATLAPVRIGVRGKIDSPVQPEKPDRGDFVIGPRHSHTAVSLRVLRRAA